MHEQFKAAMSEYIEYYNNERINTKRKGLSPL
ncbi:IS3 family transposase, partial [Thomasclavelia ramosa]